MSNRGLVILAVVGDRRVSVFLRVCCTAKTSKHYSNSLAPYVVSPQQIVDRMLELADPKPGETVYDLGSGDGRILITAVQRYHAKAVGIEISDRWCRAPPTVFRSSACRTRRA